MIVAKLHENLKRRNFRSLKYASKVNTIPEKVSSGSESILKYF